MLFYPGTMLAPGHYFELLQAFAQAGFGVAGLHLAGHGACSAAFQKLTFDEWRAQGLCAENWLHEHGYGPVAVAGHSQGGILTLAHAAASNTLAAAFAISAAYPQMPEAISLTRFRKFGKHREKIMSALSWLAKKAPCLPVFLPFYLNIRRVISGRRQPVRIGNDKGRFSYPLSCLVSLFGAEIPMQSLCPLCLLSAQNDALFTQDIIIKVFNRITAPFKELVFLPDGGHMAPYNPYLAQFMARGAAAFCAGLGFPLHLQTEEK